ncbi:hypothetical protein D0Y65_050785 [Glycine soja]|uniref:Uncharacterized protein n=1 Tax=Glycine soja TaxID=3848 RepID=A0A445FDJ4_GLYSO|nr:hypothetical protein D0Y65_050785 [Glycine soja]
MFVFALFLIVTTFLCYLAAPSLILPLAFPFKVYRSCCCGRIMARAPDNIKSINGSKEALKLARRITDLWFVGTPNRSEQAEMVIIDSHAFRSGQFSQLVTRGVPSYCYRKTDVETAAFTCACDKHNDQLVLRYSNDLDLINVVVDMLPDAEACSNVHAPILDSDDPFQLESIS